MLIQIKKVIPLDGAKPADLFLLSSRQYNAQTLRVMFQEEEYLFDFNQESNPEGLIEGQKFHFFRGHTFAEENWFEITVEKEDPSTNWCTTERKNFMFCLGTLYNGLNTSVIDEDLKEHGEWGFIRGLRLALENPCPYELSSIKDYRGHRIVLDYKLNYDVSQEAI